MDPATTQRFPLIARPRPACTPLPDRVAGLHALAGSALATGSIRGILEWLDEHGERT